MPRAAPPESANPIVGRLEVISKPSHFTQRHDLGSLASRFQKCGRIGLNLRFHQSFFNLVARLFLRWNDATRKTRLEAPHVNVSIVISDFLLADQYKVAKAEIEILFHL